MKEMIILIMNSTYYRKRVVQKESMIQFKEMNVISKKCIAFYVIQLYFTNSLEIHPQILGKFAMQNFLKGMDR